MTGPDAPWRGAGTHPCRTPGATPSWLAGPATGQPRTVRRRPDHVRVALQHPGSAARALALVRRLADDRQPARLTVHRNARARRDPGQLAVRTLRPDAGHAGLLGHRRAARAADAAVPDVPG